MFFFVFVFALLCIHYHHISYATQSGREMARFRGGDCGKLFVIFLQIAKLKAELLIDIIKMLTTIILAIKALITNHNHGIKIATIQ